MLAKKIREIRIKRGLSQEKLARLADVALNTVAKIEAGESKHLTIQTMAGIARVLGVSLDDLAKECSKEIRDKKNLKLPKFMLYFN